MLSKLLNALHHIFPPFLAVIYLSLNENTNWQEISFIVIFFISAVCTGTFGYFINDCFDIEIDKLANKKNMAAGFKKNSRVLILLLLALTGPSLFYLNISSGAPFILLLIQLILLIIYSIPPIRLKNHFLLGPLTDIHYGHIVPTFIAITVCFDIRSIQVYLLIIIYLIMFLKGFRNILLHQLDDRKSDRRSNIKTFPLKLGPNNTIIFINRALLPIELILLTSLGLLVSNYSLAPILGLSVCLIFYGMNIPIWDYPKSSYEKKYRLVFLLNDFYEIWMPVTFIWASKLTNPNKIIVTIIHLIVFYKGTYKTFIDLRKIGKNLR